MYRVYADIQGARVHEIPLRAEFDYANINEDDTVEVLNMRDCEAAEIVSELLDE